VRNVVIPGTEGFGLADLLVVAATVLVLGLIALH
jgi:hypothetical protein